MFWLAKMSEESIFRTRFIALRIYSMAVIFVRNRYNSSTDAAVFPSPSSLSDIYDRILNSMSESVCFLILLHIKHGLLVHY